VGTVHLHLRALLHRGVSQADALALALERRGEPRKSPDVRAGGLLAWLDSALYDHIIEALKNFYKPNLPRSYRNKDNSNSRSRI
jgi:hypothetical protein